MSHLHRIQCWSDTVLITGPELVSSAWHCLGAVSSPALHSVMACPDLLFCPASPAWELCWKRIQAIQHHVVNPNVVNPLDATSLAQWKSMTETYPGYQIHYDVPALSQRAATIDKYKEIKRTTVIQCFCLRWDTCYCHGMTEKIEIREDTQEDGLVLCVCIAELLLLTQLFSDRFFSRFRYSTYTQKHSKRFM